MNTVLFSLFYTSVRKEASVKCLKPAFFLMATRILLLVAVSSDVVDQFMAVAKLAAHVTPT